MIQAAIHFVDPTIPGISGRDLIERAVQAIQNSGGAQRAAPRDRAIRKALARLDANQLRDIGLDRRGA